MQVQADRLNITANNLANINTRGYKREVVNVKSFDEVLINAMQFNVSERGKALGSVSFGNSIDEKRFVFDQGFMEQTGFKTDLAIRGDGFFILSTPNGETQYSRSGNFTFDQDGYLISQEGYYVMGQQGRIQIPNKKIHVDLKGVVNTEDGEGNYIRVDQIAIADVNDTKALFKLPSGYYTTNANNIKAPGKIDIMQSFLESSNVSIVEETREMMDAKRNFESCQQVIKMLDDVMGKASSEIGKL